MLLLAAVGCNDLHSASTIAALSSGNAATLERAATQGWLDGSDHLGELESALDGALRTDYAAGLRTADDHQRVVHAAAIEWARQVRRHLGRERLHTVVASIAADPDCAGSVTENTVLLDYVEAIAGSERSPERVVPPLNRLAQQMACLAQSQTSSLAMAMKLAFDDVVVSLRINGLDGAIPYLVQAVANPMLLVHETERRLGESAPLSRWFNEYEAILVDGARQLHDPATWHGLWLYDRITGRLRGFRAVEESADENTVELATLFHTIAAPRLDDHRCSYAEMIQRGASTLVRYECLGQRCADGDDDACRTQVATDPRGHGDAIDIPGMKTTGELTCVTEQAAHTSSREMLTCLMEATGRRANPLDAFVKEMTQVTLAGVKDHCARGYVWDPAIIEASYNTRMARSEDIYWNSIAMDIDRLSAAIDILANRQAARGALDGTNADPAVIAAADAAVDAAEEAVNRAAAALEAGKAAAAAKLEKDRQAAEDQRAQDYAALQQSQTAGSGSGSGSATPGGGESDDAAPEQCADGEGCECTALSAQVQQLHACSTGEGKPEWLDPLGGPDGCRGNCDPIDAELPAGTHACFTEISLGDDPATSRTCWAVRCGPSDQDVNACCGGSTLSDGTPAQITGMCGDIDCAEGVQPTFTNGECVCGNEGGGLPFGPQVPSGPPDPFHPFGS